MRPWLFNMQRLGLCCAALSMVVYTLSLPLRSHRIELWRFHAEFSMQPWACSRQEVFRNGCIRGTFESTGSLWCPGCHSGRCNSLEPIMMAFGLVTSNFLQCFRKDPPKKTTTLLSLTNHDMQHLKSTWCDRCLAMQHNLQADSIFYPSNSKSRNHLCPAWNLAILAPVGWRGWPWGQADPSHCGNFEAQAADLSRNLSSNVSRSHLCPCKGRGKPCMLKEDLFGHLKYQNWAKLSLNTLTQDF